MKYSMIRMVNIALLSLALLIMGSQSGHAYKAEEMTVSSDPFEPFNRKVFAFNQAFDSILLKPIATGYRYVVPEPGRKGVRNVLQNLTEPVTFLNAIIQRDAEHGFTTFWRFAINSTIGLAGIFDVASEGGLYHRKEDFGQTLGVYGTEDGPYLVLPILGPSNSRDAVGLVVDVFTDPYNHIVNDYGIAGRTVLTGVSKREDLLDLTSEIERTALDPYAAYRSLYTQRRASEIKNRK